MSARHGLSCLRAIGEMAAACFSSLSRTALGVQGLVAGTLSSSSSSTAAQRWKLEANAGEGRLLCSHQFACCSCKAVCWALQGSWAGGKPEDVVQGKGVEAGSVRMGESIA